MTDAEKLRGENKVLADRWVELIERRPDYDPDDIVSSVIENAGLVVI